jgi:MoaA/NifB/PqqE/SkfB family radical SAM enzyme
LRETRESEPAKLKTQNWKRKEKAAVPFGTAAFFETGGESGIRTPDLRIMIPSL